METIKQILIQKDNMTSDAADAYIADAQQTFNYYLALGEIDCAENICQEYFGLEPDYLHEFM